MEKFNKSDKQLEDDEANAANTMEEETEMPEPAKHSLIFAATTWLHVARNRKHSRHQFDCERYGLTSIDVQI